HAGSSVWVGVGVMVPAPVNSFTLCTSVTLPLVPLELLLVALIEPLTVMSSRAVSVIAPPMPPACASTWPVAVTVTSHPSMLTVLPLPLLPALAVTVPLMGCFPRSVPQRPRPSAAALLRGGGAPRDRDGAGGSPSQAVRWPSRRSWCTRRRRPRWSSCAANGRRVSSGGPSRSSSGLRWL